MGSEALGGKDRFLAHLSTDKPVYRSGEKVYVRAVILHAAAHTPVGGANPAVPDCKFGLAVKLSSGRVDEGGVVEANVTLVNQEDDKAVPTPVAIIGLPGGLEVRHDQLKELVKAVRIAAYEVRGRNLALYWRALEPGQNVVVPISLVAAIPGDYTSPASRAYRYYTDEKKVWVEPLFPFSLGGTTRAAHQPFKVAESLDFRHHRQDNPLNAGTVWQREE